MLSTVLVLGGAVAASAEDRFVARAGTDGANDCSVSTAPCRTIGYAIGQAAAGDEVKVGRGVYVEFLTIAAPATLTVTGGWTDGFGSRDFKKDVTTLAHRSLAVVPSGDDSIDVVLDGLRFAKNQVRADSSGGGTSHVTVNQCRFSGEGGLNAEQHSGSGTTVLDVTDSVLKRVLRRSELCVGCTGAVAIGANSGAVSLHVLRSTFSHSDGGINVETVSAGPVSVSVDASVFDHCKSSFTSAITVHESGSGGTNLAMTNSFVTASSFGIGLASYEGSPLDLTLVNDTIVRNEIGVSIALHSPANANADLTNVILWNNKVYDLGVADGAVVNADHDDVGTMTGTVNDLGGNLAVDPQLLRKGFQLASTSPMIDAGTCTGAPSTDIEGDPRPTGAGCDIGADEFVP